MINYTICCHQKIVAGDGALWFLLLLVIFTVWKIYEKIINYEVAGDGAKCFLLLASRRYGIDNSRKDN
jgi:hypothetical protein